MHAASVVLALGLSGLATAVPTSSSSQKVVSYVAKFEDAQAGLVADLPVRGVTALGAYEGLYYDHLGVIADDVTLVGVKAQSPTHVIGYDIAAAVIGQQAIYANYTGSTTDHFNLKSLFFGCGVDSQESLASPGIGCTVTFKGFRNGKQVADQKASFTPSLTVSNMAAVKFGGGFSNVDKVTIDTTSGLTSAVTVPIFDNVAYDVYQKKK